VKPQEIIADLRKQDVEILTEERLNKVVNEVAKPVTYIGLEPSNVIHIGNLSASIPVFRLAKHGFKAIILLADLHALANDKGEIAEIQQFAESDRQMFERVARKMGIGGKLEYRFGTQFEDQKYFIQMLRLSRVVNFTEAEKSMDEISKSSVSRMTSSLIYPLMQVLDIGELGVNVAVGAIDQRKVHVLAIENLKKLGYPTPVAVHSKVIMQGIDGKRKMSKSFGNTINLDETQESLETKIRKAYCAAGEVDVNPILGWYKALLFPVLDRPLSFGTKEFSDYPQLEKAWIGKEITPQELKRSVVRDLADLLI